MCFSIRMFLIFPNNGLNCNCRDSRLSLLDSVLLEPTSTASLELLSALIKLPSSIASQFNSERCWSEAMNFRSHQTNDQCSKDSSPEIGTGREGSRTPRDLERKAISGSLTTR